MGTSRSRPRTRHSYARADRVGEQIRELVATELDRLGDERIDLVTVTNVVVDGDLGVAHVYYSALVAAEQDREDDVAVALEELRHAVQRVVARALTTRRTPRIVFEPDEVLQAALRIDDIVAGRVSPEAEEES